MTAVPSRALHIVGDVDRWMAVIAWHGCAADLLAAEDIENQTSKPSQLLLLGIHALHCCYAAKAPHTHAHARTHTHTHTHTHTILECITVTTQRLYGKPVTAMSH